MFAFEFLMFGTFWFWFLSVVCFVAIVGFIEFDNFFGATASFVVFGLLLYFGGNSQTFKELFLYIKENPMMDLTYILAYIMTGVLWSILKYWLFLLNIKDKINDKKDSYFERKGFTEKDWKEHTSEEKKYYKPNMDKIMNWMIWWIPSMVWTVINDPVRKAFQWCYRRFGGVYNGIYQKVLGDL